VSDLSELFEQLADGPVLLATAFDSVDADYDYGATLQCIRGSRRGDDRSTPRIGARSARRRRQVAIASFCLYPSDTGILTA
jgi:hypothetical protein